MKAISLFISLIVLQAHTDPNVKLLADTEWKAACNKIISSPGLNSKNSPVRLRSTYFLQGEELIWKVQTFTDDKCKNIIEENRYITKCNWKPEDEFASCEQTRWEFSKDQKNWLSKPMVDLSGQPNVLKLRVKAIELKNKNIQLTTLSESEEPSVEVLTK